MSQQPTEYCLCGHKQHAHGWGHPQLTPAAGESLPPPRSLELVRNVGRCLHAGCSCPHYVWVEDEEVVQATATGSEPWQPTLAENLQAKIAGNFTRGSGF